MPGCICRTPCNSGHPPVVRHIAYQVRRDAARRYFPNMRTLEFRANTNTARAENATIVIDNVARMTHVDLKTRIVVRIANVSDLERLREGLQFAPAVRYADEQMWLRSTRSSSIGHAAIFFEFGRRCPDRHAVLHGRGTCGQQSVGPCKLYHAHAARAGRAETFEIAERRNLFAMIASGLKDSLTFSRGYQLAINSCRDGFPRMLLSSLTFRRPRRADRIADNGDSPRAPLAGLSVHTTSSSVRTREATGTFTPTWRLLRLGSPGVLRPYSICGKIRSHRAIAHQSLIDLSSGLFAAAHGV